MNVFDVTFLGWNPAPYRKKITMRVMLPDRMDENTGVLMAVHGWGGNRTDCAGIMEYAVNHCDVAAVCAEYRQSGYDFDPVKGRGWQVPYDMGFYQMLDTIGSLKELLDLFPGLDRSRIFAYGASQGGQIALLSAIYAPNTFAAVYSSSGILHIGREQIQLSGREFAEHELSVRSVDKHIEAIRCPVWIDHGKEDAILNPVTNFLSVKTEFQRQGKMITANLYDGDHSLGPGTNRFDVFRDIFASPMKFLKNPNADDFSARNIVSTPCADRSFVINWSLPVSDPELFKWEKIETEEPTPEEQP